MRSVLVLAVLLASVVAQLQDPEEVALELDEEAFEDYVDDWLEQVQYRLPNQSPPSSGGCTFQINKKPRNQQPQPVYLRGKWYLASYGNTGQIRLKSGDKFTLACTGSGKLHYPKGPDNIPVAEAECVKNNLVSGRGWLNGNIDFEKLTCTSHPTPVVQKTKRQCWNGNTLIAVGYNVNQVFYPLYVSCFDEQRMESLYVRYTQTHENAVHQTGVSRPTWQADSLYSGFDHNSLKTIYTQAYQKMELTPIIGEENVKKYHTKAKQRFFARGHLAAKSDFVFATGQRSTFYYFNAAPQWQCINGGNWNTLEQNLRAHIGAAGYNTVIYTGTFGVLQLPDKNNKLVDIYLAQGKIPVPRFYYKVVHEAAKGKGTAFITINNPHITLAEAEATARQFCDCHCRRRSEDFNWLKWKLDRIDFGYSFCCTVEEFRKKIKHLPDFTTTDLFV